MAELLGAWRKARAKALRSRRLGVAVIPGRPSGIPGEEMMEEQEWYSQREAHPIARIWEGKALPSAGPAWVQGPPRQHWATRHGGRHTLPYRPRRSSWQLCFLRCELTEIQCQLLAN